MNYFISDYSQISNCRKVNLKQKVNLIQKILADLILLCWQYWIKLPIN